MPVLRTHEPEARLETGYGPQLLGLSEGDTRGTMGTKPRTTWTVIVYDLTGVEVKRLPGLRYEVAERTAEDIRNREEVIVHVRPPLH